MPVNQEWLNQNSLRNYPFKEDASRMPVDQNGALITEVQIPNFLVVDFVLTVPGLSDLRVYVSQIAYVGNLLTFVFKDAADVQLSTVTVDITAHVANQAYDLVGYGDYNDVRGKLVIGHLDDLSAAFAEGLYTFTLVDAELESSTIRPALRGVRSLRVTTGGTDSQFIYGNVKLLAGSNVRFTYVPGYNAIRIDAISGEGLNQECECPTTIGNRNVVKTINGIAVEDVQIVGDGQCVEVTTAGNKITITDTCSAPCCGCPELEFLTDALGKLDITVTNLQVYAEKLADRLSNFVNNFVMMVQV